MIESISDYIRRMSNANVCKLEPDEKQVADQLWRDLRSGKKDAHERLAAVPSKISSAVLAAILIAMDTRDSSQNPFEASNR